MLNKNTALRLHKLFYKRFEKRGIMFGLGTTELILILAIVVIFFGAGKLPEVGAGVAKGIKNFKKNLNDDSTKNEAVDAEKAAPVVEKVTTEQQQQAK